jgi:hypothetical protein
MPPNDQNFPIQPFAFPSPEGIKFGTAYKLAGARDTFHINHRKA